MCSSQNSLQSFWGEEVQDPLRRSVCSDQAAVTHCAPAASEHSRGSSTRLPNPKSTSPGHFASIFRSAYFRRAVHRSRAKSYREIGGRCMLWQVAFRDFVQKLIELLSVNVNSSMPRQTTKAVRFCLAQWFSTRGS